jgi:hypothetical protein
MKAELRLANSAGNVVYRYCLDAVCANPIPISQNWDHVSFDIYPSSVQISVQLFGGGVYPHTFQRTVPDGATPSTTRFTIGIDDSGGTNTCTARYDNVAYDLE